MTSYLGDKRISVIHKRKKTKVLKIANTEDGSAYIVPLEENDIGSHISIHPSGIVNVRDNKGLDKYDILRGKEQVFIEAVKQCLEKVDISKLDFVLIIDKKDAASKFIKEDDKEATLNLDNFIKKVKHRVFKHVKEMEFIKKYSHSRFSVFLFFKNGKWACPLEENPNYYVNPDKLTKILDEKFEL